MRQFPMLLIPCTLFVFLPLGAAGQPVSATLVGSVTDPSGLPVPGVRVTAVEVNTNMVTNTLTNDSGTYAANVKDGSYRVEAQYQGFKTAARLGIDVPVNSTVRVDFRLEIGELHTATEVIVEAPVLQTDRAETGRTISGLLTRSVPLRYNRNFQGMLVTVPGATPPFRPHSEFFNPQDSLSTNVNGQSRLANNVQIEGLDNNHRTGLLAVLIPSAEAIESVSVSTSNYDAEFGRAGGAVTNVTLRSGTNAFSGSLFTFGNTESTMASGYFSHAKPPTEYLQTGVVVGGPIRRNRAFFFTDYQHTTDRQGRAVRTALPPDAFRSGDFRGAPTTIYDPMTGSANGAGRTPFAGNVIPPERISPIARAILARIPSPNLSASPGQQNYQANYQLEKITDSFDVKVTSHVLANDYVSVRVSLQRPEIVDPPIFGVMGGGGKTFAGVGTNITYSVAGTYTRPWSQSFLMELRGGVSYYHNEAVPFGYGTATASELGIRGANLDEWTSGMTTIDIAGFGNLAGFDSSLPWDRAERTIQSALVFTKFAGNHMIKFGGEVRHNRDLLLQTAEVGGSRGRFQFRGAQTAIPTDSAAQGGFANAFASFLLDVPAALGRDLRVLDSGTRQSAMFTFVQDKWQVGPRVTIDLGLRHEYYTPLVGLEERGGLSNYDPTTNTLRVAGYDSVDAAVGVRQYFWNFAPRLGISYRATAASVIRAGYGVSTIPFPDNSYAFNYPVKQSNQITGPNGFAAAGSMAAGFPEPALLAVPESGIIDASVPALRTQAFFYVPPDLHEGALHSWNLAYQRELPWSWTADIAYVGNRGRDVLATMNLNAGMVLGADNAGRPLFAPFGRTAEVNTWVPVKSDYHALQAKLDRRFDRGLQITTSYTLGRGRNYSGNDSNGNLQTPIEPERSWGRRGEDRRHTFASTWVYHVPDDAFGVSRWLRPVLGGWQISGVLLAISGTPINFEASNTILATPGNRQRPDVSGQPRVLGGIGPEQRWFDTSVFSAPAQGTWGNVGRNNLLDGPGWVSVDLGVGKIVPLSGRLRAEFRVDAFNALNNPRFNNPDGTLGNATFGQITSVVAGHERLIRFGARLSF